jgi:AcrR family transcriptional regulator
VEALLSLLDEGILRPTAERIAGRAGVSERSLFQHFPDREQLFEAVARAQYERVLRTLEPIDASLPLSERIDAFVDQRARLYELSKGVRRAAQLLEPESGAVAGWLATARKTGAADVERVFRAELQAAPETERAALRAALVSASVSRGHGQRCGPRWPRYSRSADRISGTAWPGLSNRTASIPRARAVSQFNSRSSTKTHSSPPRPSRSSVNS